MVGERKTDSVENLLARIDKRPETDTGSWVDVTSWAERTVQSASRTQVALRREEVRRAKLKAKGREYKEFPVHLFPSHPKAPYLDRSGIFSEYGINAAYTLQYLLDYRADVRGEPRECSSESLSERTFVALMARARINFNDQPLHRDKVVKVFEDAVVSDIVRRYDHLKGWNEYYVRAALLNRCVEAMVEGFSVRYKRVNNILLQIYENILRGNGRKS